MEETEKEIESIRAASEEVSRQFKALIDANDLDSLKHLQLLMYFSIYFFFHWHGWIWF